MIRLIWWRFLRTFGHRRDGYLAVVLLVGLLGGLAMASVAGARRTQSSFPVYLASTHPSDVIVGVGFDNPTLGSNVGYAASTERAITRIPHVKHSADIIGFDGNLASFQPIDAVNAPGQTPPAVEGSLSGEFLTQDRLTLISGRMADPNKDHELVMSAGAAVQAGSHIGSKLTLGFYTDAQEGSSNCCSYPADTPYLSITLKLVGIVESSNQIVQDDVAALSSQFAILTPALTRRLATCCAYYSDIALQVDGGARNLPTVLAAMDKLVPPGLAPVSPNYETASAVAKAQRAIRPESIAFGVFGLIAALAALLICAQVIGRSVRRNADDGEVLRALGAGPAMTTADGLLGILGAVIVGSLLAVAVSVSLSPLAPVGAVRPVYPGPGISFDWAVLGFGFAFLVIVLSSLALVMAYRISPHRAASRQAQGIERESRLARTATASGLSPAAIAGIRSAVGASSGVDVAPVRSALLGGVLAVVVVVTSITFGASLNSLVSHPGLYGWNWNYVLLSGFAGDEDLPAAHTAALLNHDKYVEHWAGVYFESAQLDGMNVPVLAASPHATVSPPLLSGHGLQSAKQIVLGASTLVALHKHVGDTVRADTGGPRPTYLRIVGTATLPTLGSSGSTALQMGTGAVVASSLYPAVYLNQQQSAVPGPNAVLVTVRTGGSPALALRSLDRIIQVINQAPDSPAGGVVSVLRPAEIANYRSAGSTPSLLAGLLALGAVGALGLTLVASVRRRRREFALLKTLGFTQRQLAATVAWQSSVAVTFGIVVGLPIGIVVGRLLWNAFAHEIDAIPAPSVPVMSMVLFALGALVLANLVAALPARMAARTPTALLLRSE